MRLLDKSNKLHADKGPPPQMVDVPIDPPCCVVLTDSRIRNIGATSKYRTQSSVCCHSSFCARHKNILLMTGAISILLIILLLTIANLTFSIMSEHDARNTSAVPVQPEARVKRAIRPGSPRDGRSLLKPRARRTIDGSPSFSDQTRVLTSRITRVAETAADDVPTINGRHVGAHLIKRELSRKRRDCDLSAKRCENLLQAVQSQLEMLSNKFPATNGGKSLPTDILKCLECAKIIKLNIADESDEDHAASRSRDRYFPYDYVSEPNRSSDYGTTVIKLLDDKAAESGGAKRPTQVNRTEAAKIQAAADDSVTDGQLRDVTNQSSANTTSVSETSNTVTIDHTNSDESQQTEAAYVNGRADSDNSGVRGDKRPGGNSTVDDSRMIKMQTDGVQSRIDQQQQLRVTIEDKGITSVRPRPSAMMESSTTRYSAITVRDSERFVGTTIAADAMGTIETGTRAIVDLTKQITENVTSLPAGSDVTGIDGAGGGVTVMQQPSVRPSLEGHPENRSDAAANGSRSMDHHRAYKQFMQPVDNSLQTKDDVKSSMMPAVSTKSFQQLQLNPTTWSMPHPVCFFGYPGQPAAGVPASLSPASSAAFYPASSSSAAQGRGFSFQNPSSHQASPPLLPNMQVQANTVQFLPGRPNYVGGLAPPTGPGVGPTGPAVSNFPSIFPLNQQQPAVMSQPQQQPVANMPYFCGYMSLPTIRFPPIPGTSQFDRSAEAKDSLLKESQKLPHGGVIVRPDPTLSLQPTFNKCPVNYRQCDNSHCIPRVKWCDGRVDCSDASDETKCSCRDRILRDRLCDGYFDCPHGEDELGCFGCPKDHFSCDDWDRRYNSNNCVSLSQRCDGIMQCPNGKDEVDCNTLLEYIGPNDIFSVGYTQGYLHKNVRGQWYPVCSKSFTWAADACESEIGRPLTTMPEMQIMRVSEEAYQDLYVTESGTDEIKLTSCPGTAVYVKCPPLPCGTKALPRQTFSNATKYKYMTRRHAEEQSAVELAEFNKLYQQTLGLLNASQSVSGTKVREQNDTLVGSQSRVVGGRASQPTAWPFLVAIYKNGNFHCGGVILSDVHIISAGHCMDGYQEHYYEIQAGTLRRFSFSPMAQWRRARYVIIHPDYVKRDMQNDFAVIKLDRPLLFNRWVRQVCLPTSNTAGPEWKEGPLPQSMCVAIGWGAVTEDGPEPDHLREVKVPILPSCKHLVDRNEASICAGYPEGGHDACQGDSGGPLMCRNPNLETQWYAAGLISHGDGCGRPDEPGVYMKISYYLDWILQAFETLDNHATYGNQPLDSCPGFSCHSSSGKCLPIQSRCNGVVNCLDAEDEIGCGLLTNNYASYRNFNNTSAKPQTDGVSSDTTEKNTVSTEAIPISTSSYFFYQTESQTRDNENTDNSDTVDVYATTPETIMPSVRLTFTCRNLIQTITINKRCDKHLDCEDGTDEEDCTCRDYLSNLQSVAICDGHLDCDDETDEKDCGLCKNAEFYCSRSGGCIPMTKRCDGNFDCPLREDEVDCLTLTDGEYVNMDSDDRPILNTEGLLSRYYNGTWHVECPQADILENGTVTSTIGGNLCKYLGFQSLQSFDKIVVNETELETRRWDSAAGYVLSPEHVVAASEGSGETCTTLRFRCRPVLSSSADSHLVVDPRTGSHTYLWPWLAAIFIDGRYHCSALLLEPDWLLASSSCTAAIRLSVNYTTALLGQSRSFLYVDGPHQQVSVVDEIRDVKLSDVSLLHLKTAVNFTRYVQPLFLEKRIYPPAKDDLCVAIGTNDEHVTQSIFLQPILQNCDKCYRCFVEALGSFSIKCPVNGTSSNWSGTVFCRGEKGWYPAAVFQENGGPCGFRTVRNLTSIDYIHAYLTQALEEAPQSTPEATCDGVRCNIGQCIPKNQVCDGVVDCRDGADEESEMCLQMQQIRRTNGSNDKCARSELRCRNGECVTKSAFCDGKVDCSDGTDEPTVCSCAEYLRLTAPERLCDGVRHCLDKTDESLKACQCTETSFKCNTGSRNITCISQDFVCDGDSDCPNGEDETKCRKVQETADGRFAAGEVIQRSYGVWHTLCYPSVIKSNEEAANVCRSSGYTGGIIDYEYQLANEFVVPTRDDFYMVRLNPGTWITMRDDKPLVTLIQPEKPCYRLVVKCK